MANQFKDIARRLQSGLFGLLGSIVLVLAVSCAVFVLLRWLPSDPAELILDERATEAERALLRAKLHLNEPMVRQLGRFISGLFRLQVGESLRVPGTDGLTLVLRALPSSAALASVAVAFGACLGLGLAMVSLASRSWLGWVATVTLRTVSVMPLLAFAPPLTFLFAVRLRWVPLPADPQSSFGGLLFAAALLSLPLAAGVGRIALAALSAAKTSVFVQVARAKGLSESRVWIGHVLPTCVGPIVTVIAAQLGALLGGALVLEKMLARPGLGTVVVEALQSRDLPVLQGAIVVSSSLFVAAQAVGRWVHERVDPRARDNAS